MYFPTIPGLKPDNSLLISRTENTEIKSFSASRYAKACGMKHPRGACAWICSTDFGTWKAVFPAEKDIFLFLKAPKTLGQIFNNFPDLDKQYICNIIDVAYNMGFAAISGRVCRKYAESLDYPINSHFLALHMTSGCNLKCAYCYNSSGASERPSVMNPKMALRFIERACRELPAENLEIDFLGGEPLTVYESVKEIILQTERRFADLKKISFLIQTNGLLLDKNKAKFFKEHKTGIGVSIDGPAQWHNKFRTNADNAEFHGLVCRNFLNAAELGANVSPLAVIYDPRQLEDAFSFFTEDLGSLSMRFNICCPIGRARSLKLPEFSAAAYSQAYIKVLKKASEKARALQQKINIYDINYRLKSLVSFKQDYMCLRAPCGMGTSILSLDSDGSLYACEEYDYESQSSIKLGSLDSISDLAALQESSEELKYLLSRSTDKIAKCRRCWLKRHCGAGCTQRALALNRTLMSPEQYSCSLYRELYPDLMWLLAQEPDLAHWLAQ